TRDFSAPFARVATATITRAGATESWAELDAAADVSAIALGAPATILSLPLRRKVGILERPELGPLAAAMQTTALSAIAKAIEQRGRGFLEVAADTETPRYQVVVGEERQYEIWDPAGKAFPNVPPIAVDANDAANQVVEQLLRLGRYHSILELA